MVKKIRIKTVITSAEEGDYVVEECSLVCLLDGSKIYERIPMKLCEAIEHDQIRNWLDLGGVPCPKPEFVQGRYFWTGGRGSGIKFVVLAIGQ